MKPNVPLVRAVERAIRLLRAFSPGKSRLTLSELARLAELDKGTARRLLQTLVLNGLVEHDAETQLYTLAAAVLELGVAVETGREFRNVAAPHLARVAMQTGCTTFLWVHSDRMALCVERVRSGVFSIDVAWTNIGTRTTMNCGAGPRTLLAYIAPEEQREALAGPFTRRTPLSQTDPEILAAEAGRIHAQGWELAVDDFVLGLAGLGVPVFDRAGRLLGTISITTLTPHLAGPERTRCLEILLAAAREIGGFMR